MGQCVRTRSVVHYPALPDDQQRVGMQCKRYLVQHAHHGAPLRPPGHAPIPASRPGAAGRGWPAARPSTAHRPAPPARAPAARAGARHRTTARARDRASPRPESRARPAPPPGSPARWARPARPGAAGGPASPRPTHSGRHHWTRSDPARPGAARAPAPADLAIGWPSNCNRALTGNQLRQRLEQRRLAGPVGPDHTGPAAARQIQVDAVQHRHTAQAGMDATGRGSPLVRLEWPGVRPRCGLRCELAGSGRRALIPAPRFTAPVHQPQQVAAAEHGGQHADREFLRRNQPARQRVGRRAAAAHPSDWPRAGTDDACHGSTSAPDAARRVRQRRSARSAPPRRRWPAPARPPAPRACAPAAGPG